MDENKKYALFVKQKAEEALSSHDLVEAKTFLNIARLLFANLDGVEQMLAVVDVHMAAQVKIEGNEMDWYAILQVSPSADDNTIKEQHRKLALTLYPDTMAEPALGLVEETWAQAALDLIAEALSILSDKGKRALYDMKRITFWTLCPSCKIRHHLPRVYENCELPCPTCGLGFVARDTNVDGINAMANGGPSKSGPANVGVSQTHEKAGYDRDGSVEFVCQMSKNSRAKLQKEKQKSRKKPKSRKRPERSKDYDVEEHVYGGLSTEETFSSQPRRSNRLTQHVCADKSFDIYNFDADRLEGSIKKGQIWATYDYSGMPRCYCQIMSVHSVEPFEAHVSGEPFNAHVKWLIAHVSAEPFEAHVKWLNSCRSPQTKMWQKAGLNPLPFGEFVLGDISSTRMGQFSHVMESIEGSLTIYPQEGQVWALYRDWMPQWPSLNRNEVYIRKQNFETVLVVTGFSQQKGLDVVSLLKVPCYALLFQKIPESVRHIPPEELYRFSHMIPAHQLKGDEIPNMPKECWVLDPDALPTEDCN